MSFQLELKEFQIALLELQALKMNPDSIHIPGYVRRGGWAGVYAERERRRLIKNRQYLLRRLAYLRAQHYVERVKEHEKTLYRLTAKGEYELLRLQFALHMHAQRKKSWNGKYYMVVFDIPEEMRKYRDFFRKLLKKNGFQMLQLSVWMIRYNPRPALDALLKYLKLTPYFEVIEIDCGVCSVRLRKKIR